MSHQNVITTGRLYFNSVIVVFKIHKYSAFQLLNLIMSEMLCIHVCHAMSKLKPWSIAMATSCPADYERNLNVNYVSKKSNPLNVESQRF